MKKIQFSVILLIAALACSCKKYLDAKPDQSLVVVSNLADLQALMDNYSVMNNADPGSGEASADNYYLTDADWATVTQEPQRRLYTWEKDNVIALTNNDWSNAYRTIYSCNTVTDNISRLNDAANSADNSNVEGQAYFYRGKAYLNASIIWSMPYNKLTAATDLGVPLRLNTNFNERVSRAKNSETIAQAASDLLSAARLLPVVQISAYRPSKAAAFGLLARLYLYTGNFELSGKYADSALALKSDLIDFNTLSATASFPIARLNKEVLHQSVMVQPQLIGATKGRIDSMLFRSYAMNDLRRTIFFKDNRNNSYAFKGSYDGSAAYFTGVAVDELYLTRAECRARTGKISEAMTDLNKLLVSRYRKGSFVPLQAPDAATALKLILDERRKELLMRGIRWMDIKRFNIIGDNVILKRKLNSKEYLLLPGDKRYAIALPENLMRFGIEQNPR